MRSLTGILAAASLALLLGACADSTGPLSTGTSVGALPNGVMSAARSSNKTLSATVGSTTTALTDTTTPVAQSGSLEPMRFLPDAPRLKTYDTTFVAHQGWKQSFVIFHRDGNYFMVLDVPASAQFIDADGNPLPAGAEVGIRARVDSTLVSFEFGPHGSYFTGSRPVMLWVYLKYVEVGSINGTPDIWYQADATQPWSPMGATADKAGNWLKIELRHFSNYAVAY